MTSRDKEKGYKIKNLYDVTRYTQASTGYAYTYQTKYTTTNKWNKDQRVKIQGRVYARKIWSTKRTPNKKKKLNKFTATQLVVYTCLNSRQGKRFVNEFLKEEVINSITKRLYTFSSNQPVATQGTVWRFLSDITPNILTLGNNSSTASGLQQIITGLRITLTVQDIQNTILNCFLLQRKGTASAAGPNAPIVASTLIIPGSNTYLAQFSKIRECEFKIIDKFKLITSQSNEIQAYSETYPYYRFRKIQMVGSPTLQPEIYDGELMLVVFSNGGTTRTYNCTGEMEFICQ